MIELECIKIRECGNEILTVLSNLFSENYGVWENTGKRVKLSPKKFKELHDLDTVLYMIGPEDDILGFLTYDNLGLINCLVVREDYRRKQVASTLVEWVYLYSDSSSISIVTRNPISIHILEKCNKVVEYERVGSNFSVSQKELPEKMLERCESKYGKLKEGEEWRIKIKRERS